MMKVVWYLPFLYLDGYVEKYRPDQVWDGVCRN